MKRKVIYMVLFIVLLVAGVAVLLYPTISDQITRWKLSKEISAYTQVAEQQDADYSELWEEAEEYNRYLAEKEQQFMMEDGEEEYVGTLLDPLDNNMMGYIDIPKIDVYLPIYQGIEEKQLQSGAGWWIGSSLPTGGETTHCIITAHTGLVKAKLFTDLDQMEIGDRFTVSVLDRDLVYEVDQVIVTEPNDATELYIVDGMDYVTLYTCTPYGVNTHRLLVRGVRVLDENPEEAQQPTSNYLLWFLIVPLVLIIICIVILRKRAVQKKKSIGEESE